MPDLNAFFSGAPSAVKWMESMIDMLAPAEVFLCHGGEMEWKLLCQKAVDEKLLIPLNPLLRPDSYLARSDPADVARVESRTFICTEKPEEAGPNNNWKSPLEVADLKEKLFRGVMEGRVLYIIPFAMGPLGSLVCETALLLTDSVYVAVNMHLMTLVGDRVIDQINKDGHFVPSLHSTGCPIKKGESSPLWPCRPAHERYIMHDMVKGEIWSFGSGYGGNALLGKKCLSLRYASYKFRLQNKYAEHMLLSSFVSPEGEWIHVAAAFPSACGKTNFAMMQPALAGWKNFCLGDDIAWMWWDDKGHLRAVNPERGFFGVAPGTSWKTNPHAMRTIERKTIFTNVGLTPDGDVWWEGLSDTPPEGTVTWLKELYDGSKPAAHPNARYTVSIEQSPILHPAFDDPSGIPVDTILFGGRRNDTIPLVVEARNWQEGVLFGALLASETTAAAEAAAGCLRHDPFAMLPFCGYHMGDYFAHHLAAYDEKRTMPKHYLVNWFRKNEKGVFLWPGFGENIRIVKWILGRKQQRYGACDTIMGEVPEKADFDLGGIASGFRDLFIDDPVKIEMTLQEGAAYLKQFQPQLPEELIDALDKMQKAAI